VDSLNHRKGGIQTRLSFSNLRFATLRRGSAIEFPDVEVVIEPSKGEDAKFFYSTAENLLSNCFPD
jgi:hypothetical protein